MHIGILSDPNNFHTRKWSKALTDQGAKVTVFSFEAESPEDVSAVQVPIPGGGPNYSYRSYLRGGPALRSALESAGIDLINPLNITPFGVWAAKSGFRPCISSALGADILEYPPGFDRNLNRRAWANPDGKSGPPAQFKALLRRWYFRPKVRKALDYPELVTGDNQYLVDTIRDWFGLPGSRVRLLRWGVEPELFRLSPTEEAALKKRFHLRPNRPVVLSPRGAKAIYQADIILEAFAQLLRSGTQANFIFLGAGYEISQSVADLARELEQEFAQFAFVPEALPRETVYQLWNLVDVFVSAPIYDGYSAALAEGRYAGAIPVVNDIPAARELIHHQENGWVTHPFTAARLAIDLQALLQDLPAWKAKFAQPNRTWIEQHSLMTANARVFLGWAEELVMAGNGRSSRP